jgi:hypothetical protein
MYTFKSKSKTHQQATSPKPVISGLTHPEHNYGATSFHHFQHSKGNDNAREHVRSHGKIDKEDSDYAKNFRFGHNFSKIPVFPKPSVKNNYGEALSGSNSKGGLKPSIGPDQEDELVGGRTFGEAVGDIARPVGTAVGNVVGSATGALTGISISTNTNTGPTWSSHGHFNWRVGFNTTGRNGWIVQEIINTYRAEDTAGNDVTPNFTPNYYEAWAVNSSGNVTPNVGPNNDYWIRPSRGNNTKGHWSMRGKVYFTTTNPATQGFTPGGVPDAGILLSTTSEPSDLGIARQYRYAQGTWDSTGATPTHTGSAGP